MAVWGGVEETDDAMEDEGWEMISKILVKAPPTANDDWVRRVGRCDLFFTEEGSCRSASGGCTTVNLTQGNQMESRTFEGLRLERLLEQITHPVVLCFFANDADNPPGHISN